VINGVAGADSKHVRFLGGEADVKGYRADLRDRCADVVNDPKRTLRDGSSNTPSREAPWKGESSGHCRPASLSIPKARPAHFGAPIAWSRRPRAHGTRCWRSRSAAKHQRRNRGNYRHGYRDKTFCVVSQVLRWQALSDRPAGECACQQYQEDDTSEISGFCMIGISPHRALKLSALTMGQS
jgi:hypothetical protein